jgi:TetR/AcrR family transcriptional repressor of nem operon
MGRTSDARRNILAAAHALIELRGYSDIGVAEICKCAGVPKGSFYYFFDSKDALTREVVEREWLAQHRVWTELLRDGRPPLERLRNLVEVTVQGLRDGQQSCGAVSGCLFGNLSLELSNGPAVSIRTTLRGVFDAQVDLLCGVVDEARQRGEIHVDDSAEAARSFIAQMEGQIMFAKLYNDVERLSSLWASCGVLLGVRVGGPV